MAFDTNSVCDICGTNVKWGDHNVISFYKNTGDKLIPYMKANPRLEVCDKCFYELVNTLSMCKAITDIERKRNDQTSRTTDRTTAGTDAGTTGTAGTDAGTAGATGTC